MLYQLFYQKSTSLLQKLSIQLQNRRFLQENNVNSTLDNQQTITSEPSNDDDNHFPIVILILCIFVLMCVCGTIIEVSRRKKITKEIKEKLLEEKRLSLQVNPGLLNQTQAFITKNKWILVSSNCHNKNTVKFMRFESLPTTNNIIELKIVPMQNSQPWQAEGHISINQERQAVLQMRTSLDCELLEKNEQCDHLYLLQRYYGTYLEKEEKFIGTWSVYGSQELNVSNFCGDFELRKDIS